MNIMLDVVIPLAENKSKSRDDFEIKYCLRSIEKFVDDPRVWIVGYKPVWMTNVEFLPIGDYYVVKDCNLINKVLWACYNGVNEAFIRMSDDQYFLKPYEPRVYTSGNLKDVKNEGWHKTAFNTRDILQSRRLTTLNFDTHCPQPIGRSTFVKVMAQTTWAQGDGVLANSLYFNTLINMQGAYFESIGNPSINRYKVPMSDYVLDGDFLNHNDAGLTPKLREKIMALFPDKSKYEL